MVTRRGFLGFMVGAVSAPAIAKAENLMKIFVPPEKKIVTSWSRGVPTALGGNVSKELQRLSADFDGDVVRDYTNIWTTGDGKQKMLVTPRFEEYEIDFSGETHTDPNIDRFIEQIMRNINVKRF